MTTTVVLAARVAASTAARVEPADVLDRVMTWLMVALVNSKIKLLLLMNENDKNVQRRRIDSKIQK